MTIFDHDVEVGGVELLTGDREPVGALLGDQTGVGAESLAQARLAGAPLDDQRLEQLWTDLGDTDAAKGWRATWTLAEHAEQSLKMLQARLQPEAPP